MLQIRLGNISSPLDVQGILASGKSGKKKSSVVVAVRRPQIFAGGNRRHADLRMRYGGAVLDVHHPAADLKAWFRYRGGRGGGLLRRLSGRHRQPNRKNHGPLHRRLHLLTLPVESDRGLHRPRPQPTSLRAPNAHRIPAAPAGSHIQVAPRNRKRRSYSCPARG